MSFLWQFFRIIIANKAEKIIIIHDNIVIQKQHLIIYTNKNNINNQIKTSTIILIIFISNLILYVIDKKQTHLKSLTKYTIYIEKLLNLKLIMKIIEIYSNNKFVFIFIDNQTTTQIVKFFKQQSDWYILWRCVEKIIEWNKKLQIYWIFVYVNISKNEPTDKTIKKTTKWK